MTTESLIALLQNVLNSDMAQREEDEGNTSPLLDSIRTALKADSRHVDDKDVVNINRTLNLCRAEFERWALKTGFSVFTENGEYPYGSTAQQYWQCWKASWEGARVDYIADVALQETAPNRGEIRYNVNALRSRLAEIICDYDPKEEFLPDGSLPIINRVMSALEPYISSPVREIVELPVFRLTGHEYDMIIDWHHNEASGAEAQGYSEVESQHDHRIEVLRQMRNEGRI